MLTKKAFENLAYCVRGAVLSFGSAHDFADFCARFGGNPRFDQERFLKACGVPACPKCQNRSNVSDYGTASFCAECNHSF